MSVSALEVVYVWQPAKDASQAMMQTVHAKRLCGRLFGLTPRRGMRFTSAFSLPLGCTYGRAFCNYTTLKATMCWPVYLHLHDALHLSFLANA